MTVSSISAFSDKNTMPDETMVIAVLGPTAPLWHQLQKKLSQLYPEVKGEWKHYGKVAGWTYKLLSDKRNLLFFIPRDQSFRLRLVFGEKASSLILKEPAIPVIIKEALKAATAYAEGRSIDIDITDDELLATIERLVQIKYEN